MRIGTAVLAILICEIDRIKFQKILKVREIDYLAIVKLSEAKKRFIEEWGALGSKWGVSKTMAQIHALLLVSPDVLSTEDVMNQLVISRGNANMNLRMLIDWRLIKKENVLGERKEFFKAEKDVWLITQRVMSVRRKRELEPLIQVISELAQVELDAKNLEGKEFQKQMEQIRDFGISAEKVLTNVERSNYQWFMNTLIKLLG